MRRMSFAVICLASLSLTACNFPTGSPPAIPRLALTPTGSVAVADEYLSGVRITSYDPFDNLRNWDSEPATGALKDGVFELRGTTFWHSHLAYKRELGEGQGLMIEFSARQADARSELVFVSGDWLTASFRQFGLYNAPHPLSDLFQGTADLGGKRVLGDLSLAPAATYELLLAVGHGGRMLAVMWDPASPAGRAAFEIQGDPSWVGRKWTFMPKATEGETLDVDNFYRLSFTVIK
jgi:hypothetical protein